MLARLRQLVDEMRDRAACDRRRGSRPRAPRSCTWMGDQHFTFLGCRTYDLTARGRRGCPAARFPVPGSASCAARRTRASRSFAALPPEIRARARERSLLVLTKANRRSTVHRPTYLDYVGVRRFDANGEVIGEHRFLGLFTSSAYNSNPIDVPLLRRKVAAVDRAGRVPPGQSRPEGPDRDPRDLSARRSLPDQRRVALRERDGHPAAAGTPARPHLPEPRGVRPLRLVHRVPPARSLHDTGAHADRRDPHRRVPGAEPRVERPPRRVGAGAAALRAARRSAPSAAVRHRRARSRKSRRRRGRGSTTSATPLTATRGEEDALDLLHVWGDAFPAAYRDDFDAAETMADLVLLQSLEAEGALAVRLSPRDEQYADLKLYGAGRAAVALRRAAEPHQHGCHRRRRAPVRHTTPRARRAGGSSTSGCGSRRTRSRPARSATCSRTRSSRCSSGAVEDDGFNRLVLLAGLSWREVTLLRAYSRYLRQIGTLYSQTYVSEALAAHPDIARALVELFVTRLDPWLDGQGDTDRLVDQLEAALGRGRPRSTRTGSCAA